MHWWCICGFHQIHLFSSMVTRNEATAFQVLRLRKLAMAQLTETELDSLGKKQPMNLSHEDMAFSKNPCVSGIVSSIPCENLRPTEDLKLSTTQVKAQSSLCCIHTMQFSVVIMRHWMSLVMESKSTDVHDVPSTRHLRSARVKMAWL